MSDFKNKTWLLSDFIKFVQAKKDRTSNYNANYYYDIYEPNNDDQLSPETIIYVGNTVEVDDDDNEIYPPEVRAMNFWFGYSCDNFQDVVDLATEQNPKVSISQIVTCLNHYSQYDNFLDIK
ncbi:DUF7716 domain-containing protein [Flavobacterium collinsii]|uniref:DUF7716 domain-containing protein n=1 Tax=Flavobacterium collinsii TaxID=1114861 RepID=A0A9W4X9Y1_9FLAO|nr:hypothetical protein [Flavobacterium collinsii]CAI2767148.1 conserved protein of unknown function [Flavobacterium collinsii]